MSSQKINPVGQNERPPEQPTTNRVSGLTSPKTNIVKR